MSAGASLWPRAKDGALFRPLLHERGGVSVARRRAADRRRYAGDPLAYFRDILGWWLTPQQEEALDLIERETRVLLPSGNNLGKTFLIGGYCVYTMDAVAALPDPDTGFDEQGARVLLPGPDHDTVFQTAYSEMLSHAARAETRGHLMPGERSDRSVLWRVRPKWNVEVFSPPRRVGQNVAHTASGRHHRNLLVAIEEGQAVEDALWRASEGMASSAGNKIVSSFNPTEPIGPAFQRARSGAYRVLHLDAFQHPNVLERRPVLPDAVDFLVVDARVRTDCRDRGPYPATPMQVELGDFAYALAPLGTEERGARPDAIPGHPDGQVRVYRPTGAFTAQVRGRWPASSESGLFNAADWDDAVARWKQHGPDPSTAPDRVGLDPAREGADESCAVPAWGETAASLLRAYATAQERGSEAVAELCATRRARTGEPRIFPKSDGVDLAAAVHRAYPRSPFNVDIGAVGTSPIDHLARVLHRDAAAVHFGAAPQKPLPGEPFCENVRTMLYVRAAMLTARGLVDVPDDPLLREEILAHEVEYTSRTAEAFNPKKKVREKIRVTSVALIEKDEIKKRIGRSPDRSDGWVLSLHAEPPKAATMGVPLSSSYVTL